MCCEEKIRERIGSHWIHNEGERKLDFLSVKGREEYESKIDERKREKNSPPRKEPGRKRVKHPRR